MHFWRLDSCNLLFYLFLFCPSRIASCAYPRFHVCREGVISRYDAAYCVLMQCKMRRGSPILVSIRIKPRISPLPSCMNSCTQ
jgi:hypothetical protein